MGWGLWHSVSCPKLRVVATGDLPPRLAQVCHHSMRQNSDSCGRMLGNTYRATAAIAKNTIGFHIPNMFCGDQRQMVSARPLEPLPKPESALSTGTGETSGTSQYGLSHLLGNWSQCGLSSSGARYPEVSPEVAMCTPTPWNEDNTGSWCRSELRKQTKEHPMVAMRKDQRHGKTKRVNWGLWVDWLASCRSHKLRQKDKTEGAVKKARHRAQANRRFLGSPNLF